MKKTLVLKLGSHVITGGKGKISKKKLKDVADQLAKLNSNFNLVIVTSGAIAAAKDFLIENDKKIKGKHYIPKISKHALSSIGQPILMKTYQEVFTNYNFGVAQCLLTYNDFNNLKSVNNTKRLFKNLWKENYIPIVNEIIDRIDPMSKLT